MKPFFARIVAFLLLQALLFIPFWRPDLPCEHNYLAAALDKHEWLRTSHAPRIILVGGSNLAFGIDSKLLKEELSLEVVNMGLNASLGISFMLDEIEQAISPGDIMLLSFEHNIFSSEPTELLVRQLLEIRPSNLRFIPRSRWKDMIDRYGFSILGGFVRRELLQEFHGSPSRDDYLRELFNRDGSYVGHYRKPSTFKLTPEGPISEMSHAIQLRIERFVRLCTEKKALCFYTCPPYPEPFLNPVPSSVEENLARLRKIPGLVLLDSPREHIYPPDFFYDTAYHLNAEGARERTARIAAKLRPLLTQTVLNRRNLHAFQTRQN